MPSRSNSMAGSGFEPDERRQPPQLGLRTNPLDGHGEHGREGEQEMNLVLRELARVRCVRPQEAEGLPMSGNRDVDAADHAVVGQQR